jgi:hypothetical protein
MLAIYYEDLVARVTSSDTLWETTGQINININKNKNNNKHQYGDEKQ